MIFTTPIFFPVERAQIVETVVINNNNPWFGTHGGNNTIDKMFLLSLEELVQYFGDSGALQGDDWFIDDQYNEARIARFYDGQPDSWWLRSPGYSMSNVVTVNAIGYVDSFTTVHSGHHAVRPAMWVYL